MAKSHTQDRQMYCCPLHWRCNIVFPTMQKSINCFTRHLISPLCTILVFSWHVGRHLVCTVQNQPGLKDRTVSARRTRRQTDCPQVAVSQHKWMWPSPYPHHGPKSGIDNMIQHTSASSVLCILTQVLRSNAKVVNWASKPNDSKTQYIGSLDIKSCSTAGYSF